MLKGTIKVNGTNVDAEKFAEGFLAKYTTGFDVFWDIAAKGFLTEMVHFAAVNNYTDGEFVYLLLKCAADIERPVRLVKKLEEEGEEISGMFPGYSMSSENVQKFVTLWTFDHVREYLSEFYNSSAAMA